MAETESPIPFIMSKIDQAREDGVANFRGSLIIQLATISLLIEARLTTAEAVIQQIEQTQRELPESFRVVAVSQRVNRAIDLLREHGAQ